MDPKIHEGGDSSDSELLDNWTIVDTDEAIDASLLAEDDAVINEEQEKDAPRPEENLPSQQEENCDSLKEDSVSVEEPVSVSEQNEINEEEVPLESDTDGVSIISDSDDEAEELEAEVQEKEPLVTSPEVATESGPLSSISRVSTHSDLSDLSNQELPLDLGQKGQPQYVHHPNPKINLVLNILLGIVFASVLGLGVGHFLGIQEECTIPKFGEVTEAPWNPETWTMLNSLNHENDLLKRQLKQLQNSLNGKQHNWSQGFKELEPELVAKETLDTDVPVVEKAEVAKPESEPAPNSIPELHNSTVTLPPAKFEQAAKSKKTQKIYPAADSMYSDEELEEFQTRYAKPTENAQKEKKAEEPAKAKKIPPVDSFYGRVESELQNVMQRVANYGSNLAGNENVAASLGVLKSTISDLQQRVKVLSESTAEQSSYMVDNVKKSVSKMVQNVKHTAEKMTRNKHTGENDFWKGLSKLKTGVINSWCHIKGQLKKGQAQDCYSDHKKNVTKPNKPQSVESKKYPQQSKYPQRQPNKYETKKYPQYEGNRYNNKFNSKEACYKGKCQFDDLKEQSEWQFKRAKFRNEGRQKEVSDWYSRRADGRQQNRHFYPTNRFYKNKGY